MKFGPAQNILRPVKGQGISLSQFSLATGYFEGTRENSLHTFRALLLTLLKSLYLLTEKVVQELQKEFRKNSNGICLLD